MSSVCSSSRRRQREEGRLCYRRALEPATRYCYITKRQVTVCIDYPEYIDSRRKGPQGDIYCEHIVECYRRQVRCCYSGISPLFPNPFVPPDSEEPQPLEGEELGPEAPPENFSLKTGKNLTKAKDGL